MKKHEIQRRDAMRLDNWSVTCSFDPYKAPEQLTSHLRGFVKDHPKLGDSEICTSRIEKVDGRFVQTRSGSIYYLGNIDKKYRKFLKQIRPNWDHRHPITEIGVNSDSE